VRIESTGRYLRFRALLSNRELDNFRAVLSNLAFDRKLAEGPVMLHLRGPKPFRIALFRRGEAVWILAGHWERKGEPSPDFLRYVQQAGLRISAGAAPDDEI
jgi:hypothetical protein